MASLDGRITKRRVDRLEPGQVLWDGEVKGLGVRRRNSGGRYYLLKYRTQGNRQRWYTIGRHGSPWTPETARSEAKKLLGQVAHGGDPAIHKEQERRSGLTVAGLCDRYLSEHVEQKNKPSTKKEFSRLIERAIKPRLGRMAVKNVTAADIANLHHEMRATPRSANQALAILHVMFKLARTWGLRPEGSANPCAGIEKYKESVRARFLKEDELVRLGKALAEKEADGSEPAAALAATRLLALTGCRVSEVLGLHWSDIDADNRVLTIRDAKAGQRHHVIGAETVAYLATLPRANNSPWVINGKEPGQPMPIWMLERTWQRVREAAKLNDARLHDLRHTVGTYAGQAGANAFLVRDKLGHKTLAMTGRYVSRDADPLRALSDTVESRIAAAMGGKTAQVVLIAKGRKRARRLPG